MNPDHGNFSIVEKTIFQFANSGTWSETNDIQTITMGSSSTSGVLYFMSDRGELITVTISMHNYNCWCDVVTGLQPAEMALVVHPQYYNNGPHSYMRETLTQYSIMSTVGTKFEVNFMVATGNALQANIIIG